MREGKCEIKLYIDVSVIRRRSMIHLRVGCEYHSVTHCRKIKLTDVTRSGHSTAAFAGFVVSTYRVLGLNIEHI